MKRFYKSVISLMLSLTMIFSLYVPSNAVSVMEETLLGKVEENILDTSKLSVYSLVADGDVSDTGYLNYKWVDENGKEFVIESGVSDKPSSNKVAYIPSKYSSRDLGYVSGVRNQGGTNSCWAFSSVAAAESTLLTKGLTTNGESLSDLSEAHLVWFTHKSLTTDVNDPTFGDGTNVATPYSSGGDWHRSTFILARGSGFALEKDYPYFPYSETSMGNYDESKRYDSKVSLDEAYLIPKDNIDEIKTAVMEYGAVSFAGLIVLEYLNGNAYYQNQYVGTNHQMIIVGWDDTYSVNNFKSDCRPSKPGAWLVKNSYDVSWGDGGYFWISYEEPSLTDFLVQDVSLKNENENVYQYDGFGYNNIISVPEYYDGSVANVFTAEKSEAIESVAFYTVQDNVTYEISVYKNVTKGASSPVAGGEKFSVVTTGYAEFQGYHKVKLDQIVPVSTGEDFSVVVKISVPKSDGNPIIIPFEGRDQFSDGHYQRYCSSKPGQSFFTFSDLEWSTTDIEGVGNLNNVCVKAFTVPDNTLEIRTAEEFNAFAERVLNGETFEGKNINLMADIDFNGGEIIPVGNDVNAFAGFFLGNGYVLKNGVINSDDDYVGVFSCLAEGGEISKLGVENITVSGVYGVGAVCGWNQGKIIYCYSTGDVSGEESVGGLVGINEGKVSYSYSICNVTGEYDAGSFIGEDYFGEVENCYVITSSLEPIGDDYSDAITPLDSKYFENGLAAFYLDEGNTNFRKNVWTKRDGKTTFLKSDDEIVYRIDLYDVSAISSVYVYANSKDSIKELAEKEREGMTVEVYADSKYKVPYNEVPKGNAILYVIWSVKHNCAEHLEFVPAVEATCYDEGNVSYYICECGKLYLDENAESITTEIDVILFAFWHPLETLIKTERVEPTHTEAGNIEYYTCPLCGEIFEEESCINTPETTVIPALGHNYSDWVIEVDPECETDGLKVKVCSCGDRIEETIEPLGHTEREAVEENRIESDCTNEGSYDLVVYCSVCNEELSRETCTIEPLGHTEREAVEENRIESDCTNEGSYDLVVYCSVCNEELSRETCAIEPLGHTEREAVEENRIESDCTNEGSYDLVVYCSVCNEELSRETCAIEPLGHSYKETVTLPTETERGYITKTCSLCDDSFISEYIEVSSEVSISGTVTSFLSETDEITVEFIKHGETEPTITLVLKGNKTTYNIESILSGVYNVRVSKNNHVTRVYENVVIKAGELDFKICPVGDVNGDGKITVIDYSNVLKHVKKTTILDGYALKCADVDFNEKINVTDYAKILRHVKKTSYLW